MRVELDEKGTLVVWSDTPVEAFALTHWFNLWNKKDATFLIQTIERSEDDPRFMDKSLAEVKPQPL